MAKFLRKNPDRTPGIKYAIPFFVTLGLLTVVSFIIPLRPTVSYEEKRELAKFPEFSVEALVSGDYFDDITTWFSDTFPGRQKWVNVSDSLKSLYGYSEFTIEGALDTMGDTIPVQMEQPPQVPQTPAPAETEPAEKVTEELSEETAPEETVPATTEKSWGGVDAGAVDISLGAAIQIGDAAYNQLGFSQYESDRYIDILSTFATQMKDKGVRVISCPAPTSIGVLIEEKYLEKLNCAPQDDMLEYLHGNMNEDVITVDTFSNLVQHNDEYIYFRTDHHWTQLGAYYAYEAFCWATGMEPKPLDEFEEWDMGRFPGGLYGKVAKPNKLRADNLVAYVPDGDLKVNVLSDNKQVQITYPILRDMSAEPEGAKYSTFCSGDHRLAEIINEANAGGPNCVVIKDSFGSPFTIFLTQNYHKVYSIDYRKYNTLKMSQFCEEFDIDDVIVAPYLIATQSSQGSLYFGRLCQ